MSIKRHFKSFDILLVLLVCAASIFGIIVIGSATKVYMDLPPEEYYEYTSQKIWFASGLVFMLFAAFIDYHFITDFYIPIYILNIVLLLLVFVLDKDPDSPSRWIRYTVGGFTIGIQPSEFCKIFMIIYLAKFIDKKNEKINNILVIVLILASAALPTLLVARQPSLTVALCIMFISLFMLYISDIKYKYVLLGVAVLVLSVLFILYDMQRESPLLADKILRGYQQTRFEESEQTQMSIRAIGSGQFSGKGLYKGKGVSNLTYSQNDFIFAVVGEEFGFVGCVAILGLMLLIILKCIFIAQNSPDLLGKLLASGVAGMLAFQTFVNAGVATGLLPNTGITFPFLSAGGSSMWINMLAVGLVLNVGMSKSKSIFEG